MRRVSNFLSRKLEINAPKSLVKPWITWQVMAMRIFVNLPPSKGCMCRTPFSSSSVMWIHAVSTHPMPMNIIHNSWNNLVRWQLLQDLFVKGTPITGSIFPKLREGKTVDISRQIRAVVFQAPHKKRQGQRIQWDCGDWSARFLAVTAQQLRFKSTDLQWQKTHGIGVEWDLWCLFCLCQFLSVDVVK